MGFDEHEVTNVEQAPGRSDHTQRITPLTRFQSRDGKLNKDSEFYKRNTKPRKQTQTTAREEMETKEEPR